MGGDTVEYVDVHDVPVRRVSELNSSEYDTVVVVTSEGMRLPQALEDFITSAQQLDKELLKSPGLLCCPRVSGSRLILSPTGQLTPYHDVRSISEAVSRGMSRSVAAGALRPIVVMSPHRDYPRAELVALLSALHSLYIPLQIRESFPSNLPRLSALGIYSEGSKVNIHQLLKEASAIEISRGVSCDIGGGDPERMSPPRVAQYVTETFANTPVTVTVIDDIHTIEKEYPMFAAVNRAANAVPRHRGCIINMEYVPSSYDQTVMLVGKGVTYDTGGCDIKAGGVMAGMSRDKCGAAAVVGFLKACALLRPAIKVVAGIGVVRNSVGEEAYVADELITTCGGLAVRIGNTDAEGRLAMGDILYKMGQRAASERNAHVYTVATLTGHAVRAVGIGYSIVMDNHNARALGHALSLSASGESIGDMLEVSVLRREDLKAHAGKAAGDHVHQADNLPSSALPRGHQGPGGFLLLTSGLSTGSVRYSHVDVAASAGDFPSPATGAPLLALAAHYKLITC